MDSKTALILTAGVSALILLGSVGVSGYLIGRKGGGGKEPNKGGGGEEPNKGAETQKESDSPIGKIAYSTSGVNIRLSAMVDNGLHDNILSIMETGELGEVVSETIGKTDGLRWFYIKLKEPIWDILPYPTKEEYGYVREVDERGNVIVKLK